MRRRDISKALFATATATVAGSAVVAQNELEKRSKLYSADATHRRARRGGRECDAS